jgi:hypothetical protein
MDVLSFLLRVYTCSPSSYELTRAVLPPEVNICSSSSEVTRSLLPCSSASYELTHALPPMSFHVLSFLLEVNTCSSSFYGCPRALLPQVVSTSSRFSYCFTRDLVLPTSLHVLSFLLGVCTCSSPTSLHVLSFPLGVCTCSHSSIRVFCVLQANPPHSPFDPPETPCPLFFSLYLASFLLTAFVLLS